MTDKKPKDAELDVVIVGAGFAGLYQLRRLREKGFRVKVFEAAGDIGGIWYWNCYPGARVDSTGSIYQYTDPELWKGWNFSELYPGRDEVRDYFDYVDKKLDLRKDVYLNTRVTGAEFDEATRQWIVHADNGSTTRCRFLVLCTGFAAKPHIPKIAGIKNFKGEIHHTGLWPQGGVDCTGKRVAVIGTGASGIQLIQEIGRTVGHMTVFQRTANLALPMRQRTIPANENEQLKKDYPLAHKTRAESFAGYDFDFIQKNALDVPDDERRATYERLWDIGGFKWWLGTYIDVFRDEPANRTAYEFWRDKTRKRIKDPKKMELLAPVIPPHPFGVKRPCLEQYFYEVMNQDNIDIVDIRKTPIAEITETGINVAEMTKDGPQIKSYEFDVIALATGFDSVSGGLTGMDIRGTTGRTLRDKWAKGIRAHLGLASNEFPNLIFVYGPQSPSGFCNGPTCAELQGDWVVQFLENMRTRGITRAEVQVDAEEAWRDIVVTLTEGTLFPKADSWYMGANIPGKPRELLNYPGGLPDYLARANDCAAQGYSGFVFA